MAYINFKEEIYKAEIQLDKRMQNNTKLFNYIKERKNLSSKYNPDEVYSYKEFNSKIFGGGHSRLEEEFIEIIDLDIVCTKFINCKFSNIKFKNCRFIGCYFIECSFFGAGVTFEGCSFVKEESSTPPNLNKEDNLSCNFTLCEIYSKFYSCNLSYVIFNSCNINNTNFELSYMRSMIIINTDLKMIKIKDTDLSGIKIVNTYIEDFEFDDKDKSKLDEKAFIDKIKLRYKTRDEYEGIYQVYENIADKFKENNLGNNFGEYYFLCRKTQRKALKPIPRLISLFGYLTCGYGERPSYTLIFSFVMILIFSILYLIFGIIVDEKLIRYTSLQGIEFRQFLKDFNESLNLSVGAFASVGVNEATPAPMSYFINNIEMILGLILNGIGIGSLVKKIVR